MAAVARSESHSYEACVHIVYLLRERGPSKYLRSIFSVRLQPSRRDPLLVLLMISFCSIEEGTPEMSFPSEPPFPTGTTRNAWATPAMEALTSITKRTGREPRPPDRTTSTPSPEHSPVGVIVTHYPSRRPSTSNTSTATSLTMVSSDEMAATHQRPLDVPSPQTPSKHGWRFYAVFGCLCIISLVCALDATSLSVALPVRPSP